MPIFKLQIVGSSCFEWDKDLFGDWYFVISDTLYLHILGRSIYEPFICVCGLNIEIPAPVSIRLCRHSLEVSMI